MFYNSKAANHLIIGRILIEIPLLIYDDQYVVNCDSVTFIRLITIYY